jgi:hypothetical protein
MTLDDFGTLMVVVSRQEVETSDTSGPLLTLKRLISSQQMVRDFRTRVEIAFDGYNETTQELFEIPGSRLCSCPRRAVPLLALFPVPQLRRSSMHHPLLPSAIPDRRGPRREASTPARRSFRAPLGTRTKSHLRCGRVQSLIHSPNSKRLC